MARRKGLQVPDALLDQLLSGCQTASDFFHPMECAPRGGQDGRFELILLAGLPEDGSHDEASVA